MPTSINTATAKHAPRRIQIRQRTWLGLAFLLPCLFLVLIIVLYPTARSFAVGFTEWNGIATPQWTGLENYISMMGDELFLRSVSNSLKLGLISSALSVIVGYLLAEMLFSLGRRLSIFYRTLFFIPVMLPLAAVGVMFRFVYNPTYGILNNFLTLIGLSSLARPWLGDPHLALYSIIVVNVWKTFGLNMMLFFAGLQSVPNDLYESARMDGANRLQEMWHISLPMLRPVTELALVISITFALKTFDLVYVMTQGGPGRATLTIPIWIVENSFRYNKFGYASAIAVVFFIIGFLLILIVRRLVGGRVEEELSL